MGAASGLTTAGPLGSSAPSPSPPWDLRCRPKGPVSAGLGLVAGAGLGQPRAQQPHRPSYLRGLPDLRWLLFRFFCFTMAPEWYARTRNWTPVFSFEASSPLAVPSRVRRGAVVAAARAPTTTVLRARAASGRLRHAGPCATAGSCAGPSACGVGQAEPRRPGGGRVTCIFRLKMF